MSAAQIEQAVTFLESTDKSFIRERNYFLGLTTARLFISGIELTVILPSLWLYIQPMGASAVFMGLIESTYGIGAMLSLPIIGLAYDRCKTARELIVFLNFVQIFGNLIYSIPLSKWCPLIGRFLCGFGDSFMACYLGEITYSYTSKQRTGVLAVVSAGRMLGITLGPLLNFAVVQVSCRVGHWSIDKRNFAGILMALLWVLFQLCTLALLRNVSAKVRKYVGHIKGSLILPSSYQLDSDESNAALLRSENDVYQHEDDLSESKCVKLRENPSLVRSPADDLLSIEFLALLILEFVMWTTNHLFKILFPLVTEKEYHWSQEYVGIFYIGSGAVVVLIFILMFTLSRRFPVRDTYLILMALFFVACALVCMALEFIFKHLAYRMAAMICAAVFTSAFLPLTMVGSKALITKTVVPENQGAVQGCYHSAVRLAMVTGPLLGGIAYRNRAYCGMTMLACAGLAFALFAFAMPRFHRRQDELEAM